MSPAVRRGLAGTARGLTGPLLFLVVWEVAARAAFPDVYALPAPTTVVRTAVHDAGFVWPNLVRTAQESALGWVIGNLVGLVAGAVFVVLAPVERLLFRLFVALYCLPLVAVAPILFSVLPDGQAPVVLAAQGVFFTTLIATMLGLRSANPIELDLVTVLGGRRLHQLRLVRLQSALPSLFSGLRIAAPAAVLGAVVAEYMGAKKGLGIAIVYSSQSLDFDRTWAIALYTALLSGTFYVVTVLVERIAVPWAGHGALVGPPALRQSSASRLRRALDVAVSTVASLVIVIAAWQLALSASGLSSYFAKRPLDVVRWLGQTTFGESSVNAVRLLDSLRVTIGDTILGYVAGTLVAVVLALLMKSSPAVRMLVTPLSVALRAVPLVALTPLFVLLFGHGLAAVVVIAGLVTFFPTLIPFLGALDRTPSAGLDLVRVSGASQWRGVRSVLLPGAAPALCASARIAAPTAMLGALLAEWLASGKGLGSDMIRATADSDYGFVWAAVVCVTLAAFILYALATVAEAVMTRKLGV